MTIFYYLYKQVTMIKIITQSIHQYYISPRQKLDFAIIIPIVFYYLPYRIPQIRIKTKKFTLRTENGKTECNRVCCLSVCNHITNDDADTNTTTTM